MLAMEWISLLQTEVSKGNLSLDAEVIVESVRNSFIPDRDYLIYDNGKTIRIYPTKEEPNE